jgi:uncharacterized protein DUF2726
VRTRKLASRGEIAAHKIILRTLEGTGWYVFANFSVQQALDREDLLLSRAEFSLYTRGSFDFVVGDAEYDPVFALEFDGYGHDDPRQVARDLIKNELCARAGLPLLRIGAEHLREHEETSILEWLCAAFVASERELDDVLAGDDDDDVDPAGGDEPPEGDEELDGLDDGLGEPGAELEHPFPDIAIVATRLLERYGIGVGRLSPLIVASGTQYVLQLQWPPALQPPRFRIGPASEFVVSEVEFVVAKLDRPGDVLFTGLGRAEFASANRLPATETDALVAPIDFPWDAYGVSRQLAEFDALRKVEGWAQRSPLFRGK